LERLEPLAQPEVLEQRDPPVPPVRQGRPDLPARLVRPAPRVIRELLALQDRRALLERLDPLVRQVQRDQRVQPAQRGLLDRQVLPAPRVTRVLLAPLERLALLVQPDPPVRLALRESRALPDRRGRRARRE
jgi:hypothetical protein